MPTTVRLRRPTRLLSGFLAAGLALAGVSALSVGAEPARAAASGDATAGTADWGVKQSFRDYVTGPAAHGTVSASDGASDRGDGTFRFTAGSGTADPAGRTASVQYAGTVTFDGHDGALHLVLSDPKIVIDGNAGSLIVDATSKSLATGETSSYPDVALATLDLTGKPLTPNGTGVVSVSDAPATLTADGVAAFANFYPAGSALDPLSFAFAYAPAMEFHPAVQVSKTDGLSRDGELLTVTGSGFDPEANTATRPPVPVGTPAGVYVVFGKFADTWRPSQGATSSSRSVISQQWAMPQSSLDVVPDAYQAAIRAQWVELKADGSFTAKLPASVGDGVTAARAGTYGVYTYAAGGGTNAAHETATPVTFAAATSPTSTATSSSSTTSSPTSTPTSTSSSGTATAPSGTISLRSGSLSWGVKSSFRSYITSSVAAGSISVADGATRTGTGIFTFPLGVGTVGTAGKALDAGLRGSVRFTGHRSGGVDLLDVKISDLRLSLDGTRGSLIADVTSREFTGTSPASVPPLHEYDDVTLAVLDLGKGSARWSGGQVSIDQAGVTLTAQGAQAFGGFYPTGTAMDALSFKGSSTTTTTSSAAAGGPGQVSVSHEVASAGQTVTVTGRGFTRGEEVVGTLHSTPVPLGLRLANASGTVVFAVAIPESLEAGHHRVVMVGQQSGLVREASFQVGSDSAGLGQLAFTGAGLGAAGLGLLVLLAGIGCVAIGRRGRRLTEHR